MRDDLSIIKFLEALHGRFDGLDENSIDNTVIQFFAAPHDSATLTSLMMATVAGASLSASPTEQATFTAQLTPSVVNPSTFTYGGYSADGLILYKAGWYWGYGGVYK